MRLFLLAISASMPVIAMPAAGLTLADKGTSDYVVVVASDATAAERFAAEELVSHLEAMSGAKYGVRTDAGDLPPRAILVGRSRFVEQVGMDVDWETLGKEEYLLRVVGHHLVVAGGRPRGTLYGVYALLEQELGCRWFAPDTSLVPERRRIQVDRLNVTGNPAFAYRDPWIYVGRQRQPICSQWWWDHYDLDYISRTRHSGKTQNEMVGPIGPRHGGYFKCSHCEHNLSQLVPAKEYAEHFPQYFALQPDESRTTVDDLELCLTHPDVVAIAAERLREWMRDDSDADMFFIGQSDTSKYCRCDRCRAAYDKYNPEVGHSEEIGWGGLAGRNLEFVNRVAELLEGEFPSNRIGTFAYQTSRRPPVGITAHRNVVIWYCPIERCGCHAIDHGPLNRRFYAFAEEIRQWQKIAREIYVYDYIFPRFDLGHDIPTIAPGVRTLHQLGVTGVMVDAISDIQVGFSFMRYWMWSQSLNRPDWDADAGRLEFLDAYYGAAASVIDRYLRLASDPHSYERLDAEWAGIWNETQLTPSTTEYGKSQWQGPEAPLRRALSDYCLLGRRHMTETAIRRAHGLFEQAVALTQDDPKSRRHVEAAKIPLQRAMFELLPDDEPMLRDEAVAFLRVAKEIELGVVYRRPITEYRETLVRKIGMELPE